MAGAIGARRAGRGLGTLGLLHRLMRRKSDPGLRPGRTPMRAHIACPAAAPHRISLASPVRKSIISYSLNNINVYH